MSFVKNLKGSNFEEALSAKVKNCISRKLPVSIFLNLLYCTVGTFLGQTTNFYFLFRSNYVKSTQPSENIK